MAELIYAGDGGAFKVCGTCREIKSLREFARKKSTIDGLRNACKACENAPRRDGAPVGAIISCEDCGMALVKTGPGKKICGDCARLRVNQMSLEHHRRKKKESGGRFVGDVIACIDCGADVVYEGGHHKRCAPCQKLFRDNRHFHEKGAEPAHKPRGELISCENCGTIFPRRAYNNKFCGAECYRIAGAEFKKETRARHREKRQSDPHYILSCRISQGMRASLKRGKDGYHWEDLVGYSREQLAESLERQFLPGMSWDNMPEWEIDHIVPKSRFRYETYDCDEFRAAWAITNLRPLWAEDNRKKHAKLIYMI